jgi:hypothetical protein
MSHADTVSSDVCAHGCGVNRAASGQRDVELN